MRGDESEVEPGGVDPAAANILLVDDHPANLLALEAVLAPLGHRLVQAHSGAEALKHLLSDDFALILMDVQMPDMDGIETASLIKSRERNRHIPIIFLTALSKERQWITKGYEQGAVDYLLKPYDPEILRSKVAAFVELYLGREQLKRQEAALRARERELLERRSEQRYRSLIDSMLHCVWAARADGCVYYGNRTWLAFSGMSEEETANDGCFAAVHDEDRAALRNRFCDAIDGGRAFEAEYRLRGADGSYRWYLGRGAPERDDAGVVIGWIVTATDIEAQKRAEARQAELLARAEEARRVAEAANRTKDEFLATVSHELRAPLTSMLGWSRMLRGGMLDAEKAAQALESIERNAVVQTELIEDLLDVSRIITGKLRLELDRVRLDDVVAAAIETVQPAADARGVAIVWNEGEGGEEVSGDSGRLQQIAWNLLSNAIKFTPPGGRVEVRIGRSDEGTAELSVRDTGRGIAAEFLPYVFDRFSQAQSGSTRTYGGLGLGLAIVRHLVELHGGTVSVASEGEGKGATFTVRLPLRLAQADDVAECTPARRRRARPSLAEVPALDGVRVLMVDDDPEARELIAAVLAQFGAVVQEAVSAEEALRRLPEFRPDVLLSDIGMPLEDGYTLIRKVRAMGPEHGGDVPAAALTGFARKEDGNRAIAAGFQTHLAKPVEPAELVATVARLRGGGRSGGGKTASA